MKITDKKYVIVTKNFPLRFKKSNGDNVDNIEKACFYYNVEDANYVLTHLLDGPDEHQVIKVDITYEF